MPDLHDSEVTRILQGIRTFEGLDARVLAGIAERARQVHAVPGEIIVREGDCGHAMYLIASGSVQVHGRAFDGSDVVLARLEAGQSFGEQVLVHPDTFRRTASVRAVTNCRLYAIEREAMLDALDPASEVVRALREAGEAQRELRNSRLSEEVLRSLGFAERYRIERFAPGDAVFREGEPGDRVYLLLIGTARVTRREGDADVLLAELRPGQFFGELAILNDQPRTATVSAAVPLEVASIDGRWFREARANDPRLRSLMQSLASMYLLPRRGLLSLQCGTLGSRPTFTAVHDLPDGRRVVSTRLVAHAAFTARVTGAPEATASYRFEDSTHGLIRELHLIDGRIVEIQCEGEWNGLGEAHALLLDGAVIREADLAGFASTGELGCGECAPAETADVVCRCARVSLQQIVDAVASGCQSVEQVARATRATLVCGGCLPRVQELLGESSWTPARCECVIPLTEDVRAFRIRPLRGGCAPWLPGQHLVVQAWIDGNWVQRPYTISSAPGADAYEITVKREPEGLFSRWLFDRLRGDSVLRVSTPAGTFSLPPEQSRDVVCFVGGIGITPALAFARAAAATPGTFRLFVDYSVSTEDRIVWREELQALGREHPHLRVNLRVTRRDGRLGALQVLDVVQSYPDADYYVCGSDGFMSALRRHLAAAGVPRDRVRLERFTVAGEHPVVAALERTQALRDASRIPAGDRVLVLRALAAVACADGRIAHEERALLDTLADRYGLTDEEELQLYEFMLSRPSLDDARVSELSRDGQRRVLELTSLLVQLDGSVDPKESATLRELQRRMSATGAGAVVPESAIE